MTLRLNDKPLLSSAVDAEGRAVLDLREAVGLKPAAGDLQLELTYQPKTGLGLLVQPIRIPKDVVAGLSKPQGPTR